MKLKNNFTELSTGANVKYFLKELTIITNYSHNLLPDYLSTTQVFICNAILYLPVAGLNTAVTPVIIKKYPVTGLPLFAVFVKTPVRFAVKSSEIHPAAKQRTVPMNSKKKGYRDFLLRERRLIGYFLPCFL